MNEALIRPGTLWLVVPPIVMCYLDFGLTLFGQSPVYWQGNYHSANEMSPSFRYYLSMHPLVFVGMVMLWSAIFSSLIAILPDRIGMTISVTVIIGHMIGAGSWPPFRGSFQLCHVLFLFTSTLIVTSLNMGRSDSGQSPINWSQTGLPSWTRWMLAACLFCIPVWWFLIPH